MIFPQKLLLSEHAHDRRIHPLCTGIPKWLCCTFFQTTQIESKRKNNPLCLMTLLSEQSYNPLAAKVRHPRQRTIRALGRSKNVKGGRGDTSFWCQGIVKKILRTFYTSFETKMMVKSGAIEIIFKSRKPFQSKCYFFIFINKFAQKC